MTAPPRSLWLVAVVIAAATVALHARVLVGGRAWSDVGYHAEVAPPRLAAADAIARGELPGWWDGTGLGVPLAAEPSHGAMYPPAWPLAWLGGSPRALDAVLVLHLAWAALGVAVWARRRTAAGGPAATTGAAASDAAALVAGLLVVTGGLLASTALRGALPAVAHLPWIGAAAAALAGAGDGRARARAAAALGALLGLVALAGVAAVLADAVVLACALAARRRTAAHLAVALAGGLALGAAQWLPALLHLAGGGAAGGEVAALPLGRLVELVVPGSFGAGDPARAVAAVAGAAPWAPSLFAGVPLLALSAVRTPSRRVLAVLGVLAALALLAGRGGGWPAWLGAPELHLAALVLVLAAHAGAGLDALARGERRALRALGAGAACGAIALAAVGALRGRHPEAAGAIERALVDGGLGLAAVAGALALAWRRRRGPAMRAALFALLVLPGAGALPVLVPTADRAPLAEPPAWARLARDAAGPAPGPPARVFRPAYLHAGPESLDDAIATLAGASAARWGVAGARSTDPARHRDHDRTWLAAAREGGALLDRFGIGVAILPSSLIVPRKLTPLGARGAWTLSALPVAAPAAVLRGALWSVAPDDALDLLYPPGGHMGVLRGTVVLRGAGEPSRPDRGPPLPCEILAWAPGAIDLACATDAPGYAAVSSSAAAGWTAEVDGRATPWLTADVIRRAVPIDAGAHRVRWRYETPGLAAGLGLAAAGLVLLAGWWLAWWRGQSSPHTRSSSSRDDRA